MNKQRTVEELRMIQGEAIRLSERLASLLDKREPVHPARAIARLATFVKDVDTLIGEVEKKEPRTDEDTRHSRQV